MKRWIVYQRERFPLAGHGPLVAAFSASAVSFSSLVRGRVELPSAVALLVAFVTSLLFFLQLRVVFVVLELVGDAKLQEEEQGRHEGYQQSHRRRELDAGANERG